MWCEVAKTENRAEIDKYSDNSDFELITWLVIQRSEGTANERQSGKEYSRPFAVQIRI